MGLIGLMEGALLDWIELARGFGQEPLGELSNFQVAASGSQHLSLFIFRVCGKPNAQVDHITFAYFSSIKWNRKTNITFCLIKSLRIYPGKDGMKRTGGTYWLHFVTIVNQPAPKETQLFSFESRLSLTGKLHGIQSSQKQ